MASVQERLQLKRVPLDKWSISEQLHLATAVACSGDQNWMSVSRSLKSLCGANRPSDWFSQKSCAAQYGKLLENVDTPKRKKRNEKDTAQATVETPSELILRKLTQERINELKKLIAEERQEYIRLKDEILNIQSGSVDENQLREWWELIELEEKQREKEKLQYAQMLKEREERKRESERAYRSNVFFQTSPNQSPTKTLHLNVKVKSEDSETEEPSSRQGTSPLLTSLLKSPSPAPNPGASILHNVINLPGNQSRVTAPTITNLLTGSVTNFSSSLAAVAQQNSTKTIASSSASITTPFPGQFQTQPLTGPPPNDHANTNILQSPSQAAPTLSLLLENKKKESLQQKIPPLARFEQPTILKPEQSMQIPDEKMSISATDNVVNDNEEANSPMKDEDQQLMEAFNGLIPDNIDELADILTENNAIILNPELLEEESILDNVDDLIGEDEAATAVNTSTSENKEYEKPIDTSASKNLNELPKQTVKEVEPVEEEIKEQEQKPSIEIQPQIQTEEPREDPEQDKKLESTALDMVTDAKPSVSKDEESSDLSNDTPLAELAKQHSEKTKAKEMKREEPDAFDSDSNDDKSLESIKRGIQSAIKENNSNENSVDTEDVKPFSSILQSKEPEVNKSKVEVEEEGEKGNVEQVKNEKEEIEEEDEEEQEEPDPKELKQSEDVQQEKMDEELEADIAKQHEEEEDAEEKFVAIEEPDKTEVDETVNDQQTTKDIVEEEKDGHIETTEADMGTELKEIKDDDDKRDSFVLIDEAEEINSDENEPPTSVPEKTEPEFKTDEQSNQSANLSETITTIEPERKVSTDDEMFEDAKEHLDSAKSEDNEQITETETCQQTITIIDTDDDSPIEVIKEDKSGRMKRDYSRRKQESGHSIDKRSEETTSSDDLPTSSSTRLKLKERDRDRSESPYIDEELGEPAAKNKRRYSSTPVIDSLPNSPASSDDREYRGWKKSILLVHNALTTHRYASLFAKPITEDVAPNYKEIVLQPMDLQTLKRNIDNGTIRSTIEFQRSVMIMCYNAIFYNFNDEVACSRAKELLTSALSLIEDIMDTWKKESEKTNAIAAANVGSSSGTKNIRGRKSHRLMN